ncbi:MAG: polyphosphate polymerase domain-containing protein [Lachnospiraceae bacterium]|nr:polyphosphate polymerase domain-containing protein [Lachnospiraceae bacterium]
MNYQANFKRYELKYMITYEQKEMLLKAMEPFMALDSYGRTIIRNIYYDTENYRLIRQSIEKPVYKEKLRLRSYRQVSSGDDIFIELKKKFDSIVYKRRISLDEETVMKCFNEGEPLPDITQIGSEIDYFRKYYQSLVPAMFLTYEREAFYSLDGSDFRITFDDNILCRRDNISLREAPYGTPLLEPGTVLMEIKTSGSIPLWMARCLSSQKIYKSSFSKYGAAYLKTVI